MKLETLMDVQFKSGLNKLVNAALPLKTAFKLKGIIAEIEIELKKYDEVRQAALRKYGQLKEDGSFVEDEAKNVIFKTDEDAKSFFKEHAELVSVDITIAKLKLSELGETALNVSVAELEKLEHILES